MKLHEYKVQPEEPALRGRSKDRGAFHLIYHSHGDHKLVEIHLLARVLGITNGQLVHLISELRKQGSIGHSIHNNSNYLLLEDTLRVAWGFVVSKQVAARSRAAKKEKTRKDHRYRQLDVMQRTKLAVVSKCLDKIKRITYRIEPFFGPDLRFHTAVDAIGENGWLVMDHADAGDGWDPVKAFDRRDTKTSYDGLDSSAKEERPEPWVVAYKGEKLSAHIFEMRKIKPLISEKEDEIRAQIREMVESITAQELLHEYEISIREIEQEKAEAKAESDEPPPSHGWQADENLREALLHPVRGGPSAFNAAGFLVERPDHMKPRLDSKRSVVQWKEWLHENKGLSYQQIEENTARLYRIFAEGQPLPGGGYSPPLRNSIEAFVTQALKGDMAAKGKTKMPPYRGTFTLAKEAIVDDVERWAFEHFDEYDESIGRVSTWLHDVCYYKAKEWVTKQSSLENDDLRVPTPSGISGNPIGHDEDGVPMFSSADELIADQTGANNPERLLTVEEEREATQVSVRSVVDKLGAVTSDVAEEMIQVIEENEQAARDAFHASERSKLKDPRPIKMTEVARRLNVGERAAVRFRGRLRKELDEFKSKPLARCDETNRLIAKQKARSLTGRLRILPVRHGPAPKTGVAAERSFSRKNALWDSDHTVPEVYDPNDTLFKVFQTPKSSPYRRQSSVSVTGLASESNYGRQKEDRRTMRRYDGGNPTHLDLQPIEVSSVPIGGVGLTSDFSYPMFSTKEQDWALMGEREHIPSYMRRLHRDGMDEGQRRRLCRDSAAIANRFAARDLSVQPALPEKADCLDNPELAAAQEDGLDEKQVARVVKDLNKDEALSAMKFAREATLERTVASGASKITIDDRDDLDAAVATHSQKVMAEFGLQDSGEEDLDLEDACDAD